MSTLITRARLAVAAVAFAAVAAGGVAGAAGSKPSSTSFDLFPNTPFINCLAAPGKTPVAKVQVTRGKLNDQLELNVRNLKPDLDFDLFTVEKTPQLADGSPNPSFGGNFGFAWYQSDLHINHDGRGQVTIKTILLDQIFGFDASRGVAPVNTFNVGFWFNNPADAVPCGFPQGMFTPFNGDHHAGPVAFISRPNARTGLGPLCSDPDSSKPSGCNP